MTRRLAALSICLLLACCRTSGGPEAPKTTGATAERFSHEVRGTLKDLGGISLLSLHGSAEEMGYAEGALLCGRMTRFFQDYYLDFLAALFSKSLGSYATIRQRALASFAVARGDERRLRGLLLGIKERCEPGDLLIREQKGKPRELQYEDLIVGHALVDLMLAACSSVTVWGKASATGGILHARNLDFLSDPGGTFLRQQMIKVHFPDDGSPSWASLSWPGNIGCPTCFGGDGSGQSSHGSNGPASETATATGNTLSMLAARDALLASLAVGQGGDRVAAAEAVLERAATIIKGANLHLFWPGPFGAAVLEYDGVSSHADGRVTVRRRQSKEPQSLVCVPAQEKRRAAALSPTNKAMREILANGADEAAARGGLDARAAWKLLAASAAANQLPTLHALVMDIKNRKLLLSFAREPGQDANLVAPAQIDLAQVFAR